MKAGLYFNYNMKHITGTTITPILKYVESNGRIYPIEAEVEIWGKDLEAAKWMCGLMGYSAIDFGVLTDRGESPKWSASYN